MILGTCRDEDREQDKRHLWNNFISHIRDVNSKPFHWTPQQIPWVARLMPQPIPYWTTHTWRSDRGKKTLKNTSWDWLIAICLTMDALCDARLQVWTRGRWAMVVMCWEMLPVSYVGISSKRRGWCSTVEISISLSYETKVINPVGEPSNTM